MGSGYDYAAQYDDFWSRDDRKGSESYADRDAVVENIVSCLGYGKTLDLGCGEGRLVQALLQRGVDAYGLDVSSTAVARAEQSVPHRFFCASVLDLPFADGEFDNIVSTDCLEHIHPDDVPLALAEIRRVCRGGVYLHVATTQDRDDHWHLTVQGRHWWETVFHQAGFMLHPAHYSINDLSVLAQDDWQIVLMFAVPGAAGFPPTDTPVLIAPGDHLLLAAYAEVAKVMRSGEVAVVYGGRDAAGPYLAFCESPASAMRVFQGEALGRKHAAERAGSSEPAFQALPAAEFNAYCALQHGTIGTIVLDGTGSAVAPDLAMVYQALRPGGRVVLLSTRDGSLPGRVTAEDDRFSEESVRTISLREQELTITVFVSSFAQYDKPYAPVIHGYATPPAHLINFASDYVDPWLPINILVPGIRSANDELLVRHSLSVLACEHLEATADRGGALAVLGYRLLESETTTLAALNAHLALIARYLQQTASAPEQKPHVLRWRVSLTFLQARLYLKTGDLDGALSCFEQVARADVAAFSPTLGTKVVAASIEAGNIQAGRRRFDEAAGAWRQGVTAGLSLMRMSAEEWVGNVDLPLKGPMYEATQLADLINVAVLSLRSLIEVGKGQAPFHRIWKEQSDSVFKTNQRRFDLLQFQATRIQALEDACAAQAATLKERWEIMQNQDAMICDRDRAIAAQGEMLDERWAVMEAQAKTLDERWAVMESQAKTLDERWAVMESQGNMLADRGAALDAVGEQLADCQRALGEARARVDELERICAEEQARRDRSLLRRLSRRLNTAFGAGH